MFNTYYELFKIINDIQLCVYNRERAHNSMSSRRRCQRRCMNWMETHDNKQRQRIVLSFNNVAPHEHVARNVMHAMVAAIAWYGMQRHTL